MIFNRTNKFLSQRKTMWEDGNPINYCVDPKNKIAIHCNNKEEWNEVGRLYCKIGGVLCGTEKKFTLDYEEFKHKKVDLHGIKDFDDYPKGTTCFFIKKNILVEANDWFVDNTKDIKTSNDDTLLLRHIAETNTINISPDFWCLYHARSSLKQYNKHVFHRGKVFVDGFLRMDGNKYFWPLIAFLVLSVLVPLVLIINPQFLVPALIVGLIGWLLELLLILLLQVPIRDGLSLFILTPIFSIFYGAGIWRAVIAIYFFRRFATTN